MFRSAADLPDGRVAALSVPGGGTLTRKEIDDYTTFVAIYGAKGLAYIKVNDASKPNEQGLQSPIVKFLSADVLVQLVARTGAQSGDLIFFAADRAKIVDDALGALRAKIGHERGFVQAGWKPLWVVDFPMFESRRAKRPGGAPSSVHRAQGRPRAAVRDRSGQCACQGLRRGAQRLGNRRRIGAHPPARGAGRRYSSRSASARRISSKSSASCSIRCSTARRRMAASRSASTAWWR